MRRIPCRNFLKFVSPPEAGELVEPGPRGERSGGEEMRAGAGDGELRERGRPRWRWKAAAARA
jgi:hypothetical protein